MLQGRTPFYDEDVNNTWDKIKNCDTSIKKFDDLFDEKEALEAILHLLKPEPLERMEMRDWKGLTWVQKHLKHYI